jgi:hypothetical protein
MSRNIIFVSMYHRHKLLRHIIPSFLFKWSSDWYFREMATYRYCINYIRVYSGAYTWHYIKVKVKMPLCLTNSTLRYEDVWESECVDPCFLGLSTSWKWVISFMPRPLYPGERALGTHWMGGWVGPRAGLDDMGKWKFLTILGVELSIMFVN